MSSIDNAKKAVGWVHQNERVACRNCKHVELDNTAPGFCAPSVRCARNGFYTNKYSVCDNWADAIGVRG